MQDFKFGLKWPILLLAILGIGFLFVTGSYNGLNHQKQEVDLAQSTIETALQRRYDLIPNVVNATKGYLLHEQKVLGQIADARAKIGNAPTKDSEAQGELSNAVSRLLVLREQYPELKANETVNRLMVELEGTENRLFVARKDYNVVATKYNTRLKSIPTVFYTGMLGFEPAPLTQAVPAAQTAPTVDLNTDH